MLWSQSTSNMVAKVETLCFKGSEWRNWVSGYQLQLHNHEKWIFAQCTLAQRTFIFRGLYLTFRVRHNNICGLKRKMWQSLVDKTDFINFLFNTRSEPQRRKYNRTNNNNNFCLSRTFPEPKKEWEGKF